MTKRKTPRPKALWVQIRDAGAVSVPIKRRRIRSTSKAKLKELRKYSALKAKFLAVRERCDCCHQIFGPLDVHHMRGRSGSLLCDMRHWAAVCRACHNWIHEHPSAARLEGWIGPWGKSE